MDLWNRSGVVDIKQKLDRLVQEAGGRTDIDSAMYTTMPLEDRSCTTPSC